MQRMGGGMRNATRKRKQRAGGNDPSCGCDMQAGWPKFLTDNIPLPSQRGGGCAACSGLPLPQPMTGGGQPTYYNSNPVPDACPFPGTGYCNFYAKGGSLPSLNSGSSPNHIGGANYGEPMYLQARLRGGAAARTPRQLERNQLMRVVARQLREEGQPSSIRNIVRRIREIQDGLRPDPTIGGPPVAPIPVQAQVVAPAPAPAPTPAPTQAQAIAPAPNIPKIVVPPSGPRNAITSACIDDGDLMVDFHGERTLENPRYYKKTTYDRLNPKRNPFTRQPILNSQVTTYIASQEGGGCGCGLRRGGYRPTKKNLNALKKWRKGQSIGFTMTSSLKAKGLIPRTSKKNRGKKVVSAKYK